MVEQGSSGTAPVAGDASGGAPLVGVVIDGRYQIEALLGEGGMGLVYRVRHTTLGKQLAMKVLRPEVSRSEEIVARFRLEAQSASAIGNQHIIDISDFGTLPDGSTYFIMEYLGGCSLTELLERGPLDELRTITIALQLCSALGAAHDAGIVHRDLKPDNVQLIERGGSPDFVKVLDFGIAKVGGSSSKLTQAGQVFGTPHYMSPEQCAGTGVDKRTDIYALGVMLYEMVAGCVPFDADTLMGILTKHMYEAPLPPRQTSPDAVLTDGMQTVIMRCLSKDVSQRYQSMEELAADLHSIATGGGVDATRLSVPGTVGAPPTGSHPLQREAAAATSVAYDSDPPVIPGASAGKRTGMIAIGAVFIVAGIAAGVLLGGEPETRVVALDEPTGSGAAPAAAPIEPAAAPGVEPSAADPEAETGAAGAAAAEQVPAPVRVEVSSTPAGAEVYREGQLVGNTPYRMVRPSGDDRVELELRLEGHAPRKVSVSSITGERLVLKLKPAPKVKKRAPRREAPKQKPAPRKAPEKKPRMQNEVLDPWG